jgi:hypothetical protein
VAVRGVDDQHIRAGGEQRSRAVQLLCAGADRRADAQSAVLVLACIRELAALEDVLDRDQAAQEAILVDDREFFDAMALQNFFGFFE